MDGLGRLWQMVTEYLGEDSVRIDHARRVLRYATWILEDTVADRETVRAAALVHDIGIPEAERKYGVATCPMQEREGPPVARQLLSRAGFAEPVISHVCRIVGSHHSPGEVNTPEFYVVWDADWLVNLPDGFPDMPAEKLAKVVRRVFKTRFGLLLARRLLLQETKPTLTLVSACLAGQACRYDGGAFPGVRAGELVAAGHAVPVCPERLGGLPTPRCPAEIAGGGRESGRKGGAAEGGVGGKGGGDVLDGRAKVLDCEGTDMTAAFVAGAHEALELARTLRIGRAVLKESSPSCGSGTIYDGSFTRAKVPGDGVLSALLRRHGIQVDAEG